MERIMKFGIFVHSQSGHSSALGLAITQKLRERGHEVDIQLIQPAGRVRPRMKRVELKEDVPDMSAYDAVLFGGPIWAFSPSPVVCAFINGIPGLKGKKALCFTTSGFPTPLSGAKGALNKIAGRLDDLDATVLEGETFFWGLWCDKKKMQKAVERICDRMTK
jgi:flavodoxin